MSALDRRFPDGTIERLLFDAIESTKTPYADPQARAAALAIVLAYLIEQIED